jgi:hypothetical protein
MTVARTEAGRALADPDPKAPPLNRMRYHVETCGLWGLRPCDCGLADFVLAIEAEALRGARDQYARLLDAYIDGYCERDRFATCGDPFCVDARARLARLAPDALAALDGPSTVEHDTAAEEQP